MNKKVVVTGGHVTPALATIEVLEKKGWQIYWFGEETAIEGSSIKTLEYQVIPEKGIPFYKIPSSKFHRRQSFKTLFNLWKIPMGFLKSLWLLITLRPHAVLSFGSYLAVPVAGAAWVLGIPVVTHEQTASAGLANKIVSFFAEKVAITFPESAKDFPSEKVIETGNPIRPSVFTVAKKRKSSLSKKPLLYVTGGSRGAQTINDTVLAVLEKLLAKFSVKHQTGTLDYERVAKKAKSLPKNLKSNYEFQANYTPQEVDKIFEEADIVVSRAGANTVLEIAALGVPAVLVPIPWSSGNEQLRNAQSLEKTGLVITLTEDKVEADANILLTLLEEITSHYQTFAKAKTLSQKLAKQNAAEKLADLVEKTK